MAQLGETSEALNRLREGEQFLERQVAKGYVGHSGWAYGSLGHASFVLGRLDEARRLADRAVESSPCHPGFRAYALHLLGDIATHPDRFDAGNAEATTARRWRSPRAARDGTARRALPLRVSAGLLYRRMEKRQQAAEHFNLATARYREMEMTYWSTVWSTNMPLIDLTLQHGQALGGGRAQADTWKSRSTRLTLSSAR